MDDTLNYVCSVARISFFFCSKFLQLKWKYTIVILGKTFHFVFFAYFKNFVKNAEGGY